MADESKKRGRKSPWAIPSNSKLEADIAYFEARLSMLDEKPSTCHQSAQMRAYKALEKYLLETQARIQAQQQRRRKKMHAKREESLGELLEKTDIHAIMADESPAAEGAPGEAAPPAASSVPAAETPPAALASPTAESAPSAEAEPKGEESEGVSPPQPPEVAAREEKPTVTQVLSREEIASFDSDNVYLRTALFSEGISQLLDPVEVQEEWEDISEEEIQQNLAELDEDAGLPEGEGDPVADLPEAVEVPPESAEAEAPQPEAGEGADSASPDDEAYSDSFFDSWLKE